MNEFGKFRIFSIICAKIFSKITAQYWGGLLQRNGRGFMNFRCPITLTFMANSKMAELFLRSKRKNPKNRNFDDYTDHTVGG